MQQISEIALAYAPHLPSTNQTRCSRVDVCVFLMLLPVILLLVFQVIKAAPAGPGEYDSDWLQLLQVLSSSQSHVWPSQHQGETSSQSHSSFIPQNTDIGSWSPTNSINDELRYSPHYWGGHTPDIQPSPSYLSSSHMTSLHSSFAPQGHSHMPPELDPEDLDFVNNVLIDLDHEGPPQGDESNIVAATTAAKVVNPLPPSQSTSGVSTLQRKLARKRSSTQKNRTRKQPNPDKRTAEPSTLQSIPYTEALRNDGRSTGTLTLRPNEKLIQDLSSRIFADKLRVVEDRLLRFLKPDQFFRRWPLGRRSRRLPIFGTTAADGTTKLGIYMTDHHTSHESPNFKDTILENKRYYMFFGVPTTLKAKNPIEYYGAGYIDSKDFHTVDQHLSPLLEGIKEAAELRL